AVVRAAVTPAVRVHLGRGGGGAAHNWCTEGNNAVPQCGPQGDSRCAGATSSRARRAPRSPSPVGAVRPHAGAVLPDPRGDARRGPVARSGPTGGRRVQPLPRGGGPGAPRTDATDPRD